MGLRRKRIPFITFLSGGILLYSSMPLFAQPNKGITSKISISVGWERLEYEEHEPDTRINSEAKLNNLVLGIEGLKRWKRLFCGVRSVFPILLGDDRENVARSGTAFQTNTLDFSWIRVDGFLGYPLRFWINPYLGIRWSEVNQERTPGRSLR